MGEWGWREEKAIKAAKIRCVVHGDWIWVMEREEERMTLAFGLGHWEDSGWWYLTPR